MLIAQMVGRDEATRYLPQVLERLKSQVDIICFTDDASTDGTVDVARSYGAMVNELPHPFFSTDEGKLRTLAWHHLEHYAKEGDWILAIDCDEEFYPGEIELFKLFMQTRYDVLGIAFYHMWNKTQYRVDKLWAPNVSQRLFRYHEGGVFRDRKLACGAEPTYVFEALRQDKFLPRTGLRMKHLGYESDQDKKDKYDRYMKIDQGAFHNINHLQSILDKDPVLVDWQD